jgi:hypothetical protein
MACAAFIVAAVPVFVAADANAAPVPGRSDSEVPVPRSLPELWFEAGVEAGRPPASILADQMFRGTGSADVPRVFLGMDLAFAAPLPFPDPPNRFFSVGVKVRSYFGPSGGSEISVPGAAVSGTLRSQRQVSMTPYVAVATEWRRPFELQPWVGPVVDLGTTSMTVTQPGAVSTFEKTSIRVGVAAGVNLNMRSADPVTSDVLRLIPERWGLRQTRTSLHCEWLPSSSVDGTRGAARFHGEVSSHVYCGVGLGVSFSEPRTFRVSPRLTFR